MAESSLEFGKIHNGKKIDLMVETGFDDDTNSNAGLWCRCSVFLGSTNTRIGDIIVLKIKGEPKAGILQINILSQYQRQGYEADACEMVMPLADDLGLEELEMLLVPSDSATVQILDRLQYLRVDQDEAPGQPDALNKPVRFWVSRLVTEEDRKYARIVDGLCVAAVIFAVIGMVLYSSINTIIKNVEKIHRVVFLFLFIPCVPIMFKSGSLASKRHKIPPKKWLVLDLIATSIFALAVALIAVFA